MKILHVVNSLEYGGLERLALELSARLNHGRDASRICCLQRAGALAREADARQVPVTMFAKRPGVDTRLIIRLAALIRRERIEVVHAHNMSPLIYGSLAARLAGARATVYTKHGREDERCPRIIWRLNRAVVAISEDAKRRLAARHPVRADQIRVIYNGIDVEQFDRRAAADTAGLELPAGALVIGTVGRIAPEKDHATLLRAFAQVRRTHPAVLLIVGDGPLGSDVRRLAETLGLGSAVRFLGFRDDVAALLRRFDVFVLPSLTEGVSLTLLEAMAAGKPVVATRVGGTPEVVEEGITGYLTLPQDPAALAEAIRRVASDDSRAGRMGQAGRRRVEERFSFERMAREYRALYEATLLNGAGRG